MGRTKAHVAVKVVLWIFLLAIDEHSNFPNVEAVIPMASAGTSRLQLDPQDAAFLLTGIATYAGGPLAAAVVGLAGSVFNLMSLARVVQSGVDALAAFGSS